MSSQELTNTGPRGFYWDRLRVPNGSYSTNPLSPSGKDALRANLMHKQEYLVSKSTDKLSAYMGKSLGPRVDATMGRTAPVESTRLLVDRRAQDLSAESGFRRSMPTNVVDLGSHVNNNVLRFRRQQNFASGLTLDGGGAYNANTCSGNWVEERREPSYASGFHARELGLSQVYQTENSARFKPPSQEYYNKVASEQGTAKFPPAGPVKPSGNSSDGHFIYYAKGFGDNAQMDHTIPAKRGGYWVGTAPTAGRETIAATSAKQGSFEFQMRCSIYDPKAKILAKHTNPMMETTVGAIKESQRFTSTWKTSYSVDYKDLSRRAITPQPARSTGMASMSARPITAACV